MAAITGFTVGLQGSTGTTVYAEWGYSGSDASVKVYKSKKKYTSKTVSMYSQIAYFKIHFQYLLNGVWFNGDFTDDYSKDNTVDGTGKYRVTYSAPAEATEVRAAVWMVANTYNKCTGKKNKYKSVSTSYFTTQSTDWTSYVFVNNAPDKPSAPTVTMDDYTLILETETSDTKAKQARFRVYKDNAVDTLTDWLDISWPIGRVKHTMPVLPGYTYTAAVQYLNTESNQESAWSDNQGTGVNTVPEMPTGLVVTPVSTTAILVNWDDVSGVSPTDGYTVEYANNKSYFGTSTGVTSASSDISQLEVTGLDAGYTWYFRVKANNTQGSSAWTEPVSQTVAVKPGAPTTWTLSNSIKQGDKTTLYWTHNSGDASKMSSAVISYKVNGVSQPDITFTPPASEEENPIYSYELNTSSYSDGTIILWKIKTKGVHASYSDYSVERSLKVYGTPSLTISVPATVTQYPIAISMIAGPQSQTPISYSISITARNSYEALNAYGEPVYISEGTKLYHKTFVSSTTPYNLSLTPSDITLQSGQSYKITATVSMSSGILATYTTNFSVNLGTLNLFPDGDIDFDNYYYTASIRPYCYGNSNTYDARVAETSLSSGQYTFNKTTFKSYVSYYGYFKFEYNGTSWKYNNSVVTLSNYGITLSTTPTSGDYIIVAYEKTQIYASGVTLSVYRKEVNGDFVLIGDGITNDGASNVVDPHPSLSNAEYRIIARSSSTGYMEYVDVSLPVDEKSIVLQWNERFTQIVDTMEMEADDDSVIPSWTGSMLELPYNISISETNEKDVVLTGYIGRKYPVSYYGTQRGTKATWSTEIPKSDTETLDALRQLDLWADNVYVREPNGYGYWAQISISLSINYDSLIIPVSLNVVRVESSDI